MKKLFLVSLAVGIGAFAHATSINVPAPTWLNGNDAYALGVQVPVGQSVTQMTISFYDVQLTSAPKGYLYVDLLNGNSVGVWSDGDQPGDYFAGKGVALGVQQFDRWNETLSFSYTLSATQLAALNTYSADGTFGIGLDPDCYFYTPGYCTVNYQFGQATVPDRVLTASLLGMSFLALLLFGRKLAPK